MSRQTQDVYAFAASSALSQERDDLVAELIGWAESKLQSGIRPIALQRALLDVSDLSGGHGDAGAALVRAFRPSPNGAAQESEAAKVWREAIKDMRDRLPSPTARETTR